MGDGWVLESNLEKLSQSIWRGGWESFSSSGDDGVRGLEEGNRSKLGGDERLGSSRYENREDSFWGFFWGGESLEFLEISESISSRIVSRIWGRASAFWEVSRWSCLGWELCLGFQELPPFTMLKLS